MDTKAKMNFLETKGWQAHPLCYFYILHIFIVQWWHCNYLQISKMWVPHFCLLCNQALAQCLAHKIYSINVELSNTDSGKPRSEKYWKYYHSEIATTVYNSYWLGVGGRDPWPPENDSEYETCPRALKPVRAPLDFSIEVPGLLMTFRMLQSWPIP